MNKLLKATGAVIISLSLMGNVVAQEGIFSPVCPITGTVEGQPEVAGVIVGLLAQAIIPMAVDWGAEALAAQGRPETKTWDIKGSSYLLTLSSKQGVESTNKYSNFSCLTVAVPDVSSKPSDKPHEDFYKEYKTGVLDNRNFTKIFPADPLIYIEFGILTTKDNRFFKLVPQLLYYKRPTTTSWTSKPRDLSFTFNFKQPAETTPFASTVISFENLVEGEYRNYKTNTPKLGANGSEWLPLAGTDDADQRLITAYKLNYQEYSSALAEFKNYEKQFNQLQSVANGTKLDLNEKITKAIKDYCEQLKKIKEKSDYCPTEKYLARKSASQLLTKLEALSAIQGMQSPEQIKKPSPPKELNSPAAPFNLSLTITETRDATAFFKHLADALDKKKGEISEELVKSLDPSQRKLAKEAKVTEDLKNASDKDSAAVNALSANQEVLNAQIALDNAMNSETSALAIEKLKNDLLIAKINANKAYRAAGLPTIEYAVPSIP